MTETIYLTGFMGAGKTSVGRELGRRLAMSVFDTDEVIEQVRKTTITNIFSSEGEEQFRDYEKQTLRNISWDNVIITTGGGMIINEDNRRFMASRGVVIYLHCDPKVIVNRLAKDTTRPLLEKNKEQMIFKLFESRLPYYLEADYTVNTTMKAIDSVVDEILSFLHRHERFWA